MDSVEAILIVTGESPCVLELADGKLEGLVKQRYPIGAAPNGEPLKQNAVIVAIPTQFASDDQVLAEIEDWLIRHRDVLMQCDAAKTIEFYTYLQSDIGSRSLTIPDSLIRIAAELKLNVANQSIRILTEEESNLKR
ncbi:MAG: hypothetical protein AAF939_04555 [Planctomycetota bacterium]